MGDSESKVGGTNSIKSCIDELGSMGNDKNSNNYYPCLTLDSHLNLRLAMTVRGEFLRVLPPCTGIRVDESSDLTLLTNSGPLSPTTLDTSVMT